MADDSPGSGSTGFILGAIVVVLVGVVWYLASDGNMFGKQDTTITLKLPDVKVPDVKVPAP